MPTQDFDTDTLARYLHISPGQVQKLAERGNVPGRRIAGQWRFSKGEIHHWLEERIGAGGEADLHQVQALLDRAAPIHEAASVEISELLLPEAIAIPLAARTRSSVIKAMVELAANIVSPPLRRGTPAKPSGLATRSTLPRLAGYTPLLAPLSGGRGANVSGGHPNFGASRCHVLAHHLPSHRESLKNARKYLVLRISDVG